MADHSADLVAGAGTGGQLSPLRTPFTDQELKNYVKKLIAYVKKIGQGASEVEVYRSLHLPGYLPINASSSDEGTVFASLVTLKWTVSQFFFCLRSFPRHITMG
jgi:hypothetical protein